ncbi:MAG: cytochrome-c peroxidase [Candidatus Polarisedimenticolaceae bacterium]|nr:cytochrome-c peroxidase [Candidatus Polarisedimenticolaceae bacterium]
MLNKRSVQQIAIAMAAGLLLGPAWGYTLHADRQNPALVNSEEPIRPLPESTALNPQKVTLGARLFRDPRLSRDNTISCQSCHDLDSNGADNQPLSVGINGHKGATNTPTVFNSSFNFRQLWDGRAESLEEQIDGPIANPDEMGSSWVEITGKLQKVPDYIRAFASIYPAGLTPESIKDAIATFERSLTVPAPFDRFLSGELHAISAQAEKGYRLFKSYGCIACHQGMNVGGNMFQNFGLFGDYFEERGEVKQADLGRYNVTGREIDRHRFKVPSLRNVAVTAPYLHDGSIETLEETIRVMGRYQLGTALPVEDVGDIMAFLESLTGRYEGQL